MEKKYTEMKTSPCLFLPSNTQNFYAWAFAPSLLTKKAHFGVNNIESQMMMTNTKRNGKFWLEKVGDCTSI